MKSVVKRIGLQFLLLAMCVLAMATSSLATTITRIPDDDLIVGARAIVTGKVLSIETGYDQSQDRIYTYITIKVQDVIKGQISERKIVLKELGGVFGDRVSVIFGNPEFKRNEKVLLYLDTWKDGSLRTYQMLLGKFSIVTDQQTGHQFVVRDLGDEHITVLPSSQNQVNAASTDRMERSAYLDMVRGRLTVNQERSQSFEATYYRNVALLAAPPGYSRAVSKGDIRPQYVLLGPPYVRWYEPDSGQPVTYTINPHPSVDPNIPALVVAPADVAAAANSWSTVSGSALQIVYAGNLDQCYTSAGTGGINVVSNNCDGRNSPTPSCASILAWGGYSGATYSPKTINGTTFSYRITQGFVSCNPWAACTFGDHCSVQFILTHEMGHALGLGHSQFQQATMYAIAIYIARCATLYSDDQDAIRFVYPASGGGGGGTPLSVVTTALGSGTVGTGYSQALAATGGTPPYGWAVASGSLPPGLTLSAGGTISGVPTSTGTYNFTVQVADATSTTAQKALSIVVAQGAGTTYDSQFISQSVPTTLSPGQVFQGTLNWLNTGTATWDGSTGLRLISQNPVNNVTWGGNTLLLPGFLVLPGQQLSVSFQAIAPTTPGTYNFQWIVARDANTPFGQASTNLAIQVGSGGGGGGGTNNAAFMSQSVPTAMTAGQTAAASVVFNNNGTTTWSPGTYMLTSLNPTGNSTWGVSQVQLSSAVAPGANATFNFNLTAPAAAGTYNCQWGMMQSGVGTFGAASTNVAVSVTGGGGGGGGGGGNAAQFLLQNVPTTWIAGQTYTVSISMKNTGTTTWSPLTYKLGSQSPANNTNWGTSRATVSKSIPPNAAATFSFNVTAPTTPGTYNFQWQMIQEGVGFFGDLSTNKPFTVSGGGGGGTNNAAFMSQSVPTAMTAGQTTAASVVFNNNGTTTWSPGTYMLTSLNPTGNSTWGVSQVQLTSAVAPGGNATFNFNLTAPAVPGSYNCQWGMMQSGVGTFGAASTNVAVNVTSGGGGGGGGGTNNAAFVIQSVPSALNTGQAATVSVTMNNNGTTTWAAGSYSLQSQNPASNTTWGLNRVNLAAAVAPGGNATFSFTITAPATAGTYNFQWRMAQDGVGAFGALTTNVAVNVTQAGGGQPLVITTTTLPNGTLNSSYSAVLSASGGTPPLTWSLLSGNLPPGLTLNSSTGVISGTPTAAGGFSFTVQARDQVGVTASKALKMTILSR